MKTITYVAFYNAIHDLIKGRYLYKNIYTTIPMIIDEATSKEEAIEIAKSKQNRHLVLDEVRKINVQDRKNILKFYG